MEPNARETFFLPINTDGIRRCEGIPISFADRFGEADRAFDYHHDE
jgi:hypothetical protein